MQAQKAELYVATLQSLTAGKGSDLSPLAAPFEPPRLEGEGESKAGPVKEPTEEPTAETPQVSVFGLGGIPSEFYSYSSYETFSSLTSNYERQVGWKGRIVLFDRRIRAPLNERIGAYLQANHYAHLVAVPQEWL